MKGFWNFLEMLQVRKMRPSHISVNQDQHWACRNSQRNCFLSPGASRAKEKLLMLVLSATITRLYFSVLKKKWIERQVIQFLDT